MKNEYKEDQMVDVERPVGRGVVSEWLLTAALFCQHESRTEDNPLSMARLSDAAKATLEADQDSDAEQDSTEEENR